MLRAVSHSPLSCVSQDAIRENNSMARGSENRFHYFASLTCSLFSSYTPNFLATGFRVG
jgi:hypothetical protein